MNREFIPRNNEEFEEDAGPIFQSSRSMDLHAQNRYKEWNAGQEAREIRIASLLTLLEFRRFNQLCKPERPNPVLSLDDKVICTPGNISVLSGKSKDGKTAASSAVLAAAMNDCASRNDCLNFRCSAHMGKTILHFDTEQSRFDHYKMVERALRRAGLVEAPSNLESYCISDVDPSKRLALLEATMEYIENIFIVLIDGIGDFINDPNNGPEAFALVARLQQLAIHYNCPILTVLHENPGSDSGKTRGHLGSHLERKAETNLRLSKTEGVTTMWVDKGRHCTIPKEHGVRFHFSEDDGMHVLAPSQAVVKANEVIQELRTFAISIYESGTQELSWTELRDKIMNLGNLSQSGARKRLERLEKINLIKKSAENKYFLNEGLSMNLSGT